MSETLTARQKREVRGVWEGTCNQLKCLAPKPAWLDSVNSSYVCEACAKKLNAAHKGKTRRCYPAHPCAGCRYPVHPSSALCGECACEDDCSL